MFGSIHHTKMGFVTCCAAEEWGHNSVKCLVEYTALPAFHVSKAMAWQKNLFGDICRELQLTLKWISQSGKVKAKKQTAQRKHKWSVNEWTGWEVDYSEFISCNNVNVIFVFRIIVFTKERMKRLGKNLDKLCSGVQKSKHSRGHLLLTQDVCLFFHFHSNAFVVIYDP